MNMLVDPETGAPRWDAASRKLGPKEDFAFEAALRLQSGKTTLDCLKADIIEAANIEWSKRGKKGRLHTLNNVKEAIGKSGKDWFFEIQRVAQSESLLQELIDQEGRGLSSLSRRAGPIQAQSRKGFGNPRTATSVKDLSELLDEIRRAIVSREISFEPFLREIAKDLAKYRQLLEESRR